MSQDDFFIGWSADTPKADRRAFLAGGVGLVGAGIAGAAGLAALQNRPGPGTWNQGDVRTFTGIATAEPYAMLRTTDIDGTPKTALLACMGKCGVAARIGSYAGQAVQVRGSLIQRGRHAMIAVVDGMDWIAPAETAVSDTLGFPESQDLGTASLAGMIIDTKCWFGAMRPSEGKIHKACAALCIRGGIPAAFLVRDSAARQRLLLLTVSGGAPSEDVLPLVAEPISVAGTLRSMGDLVVLDTNRAQIAPLRG